MRDHVLKTSMLFLLLIMVAPSVTVASLTDTFRPACARYVDPPPKGWKRWSDKTAWPGGTVPGVRGRKSSVTIPCGAGIILDTSVTLDKLIVEGWLRVQGKGPFQVNANFIIIKGKLNIGTESSPYSGKITFNLTNGGYEYTFGENTVGIKAFAVIGGSVELNGMYGGQVAWTKLKKTANKGSTSLTLQGDVSAWPVGGTIAISSTDYEYTQAEQRVITSVSKGRGFTTIKLDSPLKYMHWGDPIILGSTKVVMDESAEVALLSRSIVIQGSPESDPLIGGHFVVFKTRTKQRIIGVEFNNMGQQGTLGRYPVHFHLSQDATGSYVKKCAVHHSNQRCYVVHGTWNLLIDGNSAYKTKGHCYFLEDGVEFGNTFSNNLGFYTESLGRGPSGNSPRGIQSDGSPATFWISNPDNNWINNVAGGSQESGFWFELSRNVLGVSAGFPEASGVKPHYIALRKFEGNVAHSNYRVGLRTYSDGFRPRENGGRNGQGGPGYAPARDVVMKNFRAYKNAMVGMFIHESDSIIIDGGYFADNRVVALELHQVEKVVVKNAIVLGETENIGNPSNCDQTLNHYANCEPFNGCTLPSDPSKSRSLGAGQTRRDSPMFGILIDQSVYPSHGLTVLPFAKGAPYPQKVQNVTFGNFNNRCKVSAAITANGRRTNALFLASHSSRKLRFLDKSPRIYMALRNESILGFEPPGDSGPTCSSYVFRDEDGTLGGGGVPGTLVTRTKALFPVARGSCRKLNGGYAYSCPNTCYRTVAFTLAGISGTPIFTITRTADNVQTTIEGFPTTFLNLLAGLPYKITISPTPSAIEIWYADPLGCTESVLFQLNTPRGFSWETSGASWLSCSGANLDPKYRFQMNSGCFGGEKTPSLQLLLGGKSTSTMRLTLTSGSASCSYLQCGLYGIQSSWRYNDYGVQLSSPSWSKSSSSTSGWKNGTAIFGFGGGDKYPTTINSPSQMSNSLTWYFKTSFGYTLQSCLENLVLGVIVNDGVVVYINGREIYRNNLPQSQITATTPALSSKGDWNTPAYTTATIPISRARLISGSNTLAVEVHAYSRFAWNARFDLYLAATGSNCRAKSLYATDGLPTNGIVFPDVN